MSLLLEHPGLEPLVVDDAAARRTLREQIARLDEELGALGAPLPAPSERGVASLLGIEELEQVRDSLAARAADVRAELDERGRIEEGMRRAREELLQDPAAHPFARVSNADIGEPGCHDWQVRPRFGLLGMLAGWWRVVVSSGCPLSTAPRDTPRGVARERRSHPPCAGGRRSRRSR